MALPEITSAEEFKITIEPTKTYKMDFENMRIVGTVDELEAMVQAVRKMVTTPRYSERIYSGDYGSQLRELVGKPFPYIKAKVRQILEDTFSTDDRIKGITKLEVIQTENDEVQIRVNVLTEYGEIYTEQTIRG